MAFYKCGHERGLVIMDSNPLSLIEYFNWKDEFGYDGDKSLCWDCYCKKDNELAKKLKSLDKVK